MFVNVFSITMRWCISKYFNHNDNSSFSLACVSAMVECDKVEYDTQRKGQDADVDKCTPEQWRVFTKHALGSLATVKKASRRSGQ